MLSLSYWFRFFRNEKAIQKSNYGTEITCLVYYGSNYFMVLAKRFVMRHKYITQSRSQLKPLL